MPAPLPAAGPRSIVLFDGVCNLCNATVQFIIDRDARQRFAFAPLQSAAGRALIAKFALPAEATNSVIVIHGDRCFTRSTAALEIVRRLDGPWPLLFALVLIPRHVRDALYDGVARHRYRWFGRRDSCRMPTPETAARFLDGEVP